MTARLRETSDVAAPVFAPMLAGRGRPDGPLDGWVVEPKLDGWRCIVTVHDGRASVRTRSGRHLPERLPALERLAAAGTAVVLDAELIAGEGRCDDFYRLSRSLFAGRATGVTVMAFDVLWVDGRVTREAAAVRAPSPPRGPRAPRRGLSRAQLSRPRRRCPVGGVRGQRHGGSRAEAPPIDLPTWRPDERLAEVEVPRMGRAPRAPPAARRGPTSERSRRRLIQILGTAGRVRSASCRDLGGRYSSGASSRSSSGRPSRTSVVDSASERRLISASAFRRASSSVVMGRQSRTLVRSLLAASQPVPRRCRANRS